MAASTAASYPSGNFFKRIFPSCENYLLHNLASGKKLTFDSVIGVNNKTEARVDRASRKLINACELIAFQSIIYGNTKLGHFFKTSLSQIIQTLIFNKTLNYLSMSWKKRIVRS